MKLRVLVVDDTVTYRRLVSDILADMPEVEVVGTASNGRLAMSRIAELKPDLVTLDVEMPEMDGLQVLQSLRAQGLDIGVIMVSAFTVKGSNLTIKALELGAFDFITKPAGGSVEENRARMFAELQPRIRAYARRWEVQSILKGKITPEKTPPPRPQPVLTQPKPAKMEDVSRHMDFPAHAGRPDMIAIGISTGGPNALASMLPRIPAGLGLPVLIVQHMPPLFTQSLAESLSAKCKHLRIKEAEHGEHAHPGTVYLAPGGRHMKLIPGAGGQQEKVIHITDDPPENHCRPSVDYLFRSLAHGWPGKVLAVIMTGMGNDGVLGLRLLKRHGAVVIAQDEASSVVFGMPKEAITAGVVDIVAPLETIADEIFRVAKGYAA